MVQGYLEKVYAGFLGMNVGIRLGAPVEPSFWSYERIRRFYGDIRGYVKPFRHFAADDDANGPVYFLRALDDMRRPGEPAAQDVAEAWLNYAREGVGLYWWGGYGVSTEHTAWLNLESGIPAPLSGSAEVNGKTLAEQIGGQIFVDTWGLVAPCDPPRAARYARTAASVSHDGEALNGAAFMAAAISRAFESEDTRDIAAAALAQLPEDCLYRRVFDAVRAFHGRFPDDWRACREMLEREWGYDRYPGACHVIPNAGVCALALYYGESDFSRTVEIATMCSWDTDCNAGNLGTILGVARGLGGIPWHYRGPVNDEIVLSGISGYLNILDIPSYCVKLADWGCRLAGEPSPHAVREGELRFDFRLPGSTHGFRCSDASLVRLDNGGGCLRALLDRVNRGQGAKIFYKPFWRREDFDDERYMPVFTPTAWPGQTVSMRLSWEKLHGESVCVTPYVRETYSRREIPAASLLLKESADWSDLSFVIPDLDGGLPDEIGLKIESNSPAKFFDAGCLRLSGFQVTGKARYTIGLAGAKKEFGSVLPFSHNHGAWELEEGRLTGMGLGHAEAMTGSYFMRDLEVSAPVRPLRGASHLLGLRVQGARRGYYAGFHGEGEIAILKHDGGLTMLSQGAFPWAAGEDRCLSFRALGSRLTLEIDGKPALEAEDGTHAWGMAAFAQYAAGRSSFGDLSVREL